MTMAGMSADPGMLSFPEGKASYTAPEIADHDARCEHAPDRPYGGFLRFERKALP